MRSFDLIVFDWDGTLSDSLDVIVRTMQGAIGDLELEHRSAVQIRSIVGLGMNEAVARLYPDLGGEQRERLGSRYRERFRSVPAGSLRLFPGVRETLATLHDSGYNLGIATGKSRRGLNRELELSGLATYIHASRCADEAFSKPHPQMLTDLMAACGISADRTLMVGDSQHDMQMAASAGVAAAAVGYGAEPPACLLEFHPLVCLKDLRDLPAWLDPAIADDGRHDFP